MALTPGRSAALGLAGALAASAAAGSAAQDEQAIRAIRADTNAAIQARDLSRFLAPFTEHINIVGGNGGVVAGKAALKKAFAASFSDPEFVHYIRTPERVDVGQEDRAAEYGHWVGLYEGVKGRTTLSGDYLAYWLKAGAAWRIRAEVYVTLQCEGPGCAS